MSNSGVSEVKIEQNDFKLTIKTPRSEEEKDSGSAPQQVPHYIYGMPPQMPYGQQPPQAQPQEAPAQPSQGQQSEEPSKEEADQPKGNEKEIKAPMIGTFYRSPGPDKDPFVKVGDHVKEGETVCIIEAMKLFNEIEAEFSGKITKILVDDATPVEYDQPLFLVEPDE